jgi:hypothetical protein
MATIPIGEAAAEALLAAKDELARSITDALYSERPDLLEKYGERGRAKCLQDMRYNVEHLAPAVGLGEPELFASYVVWLRDMLAARDVPADEIRRSLELTGDAVRHRFTEAEAAAITRCIEAGLEALG